MACGGGLRIGAFFLEVKMLTGAFFRGITFGCPPVGVAGLGPDCGLAGEEFILVCRAQEKEKDQRREQSSYVGWRRALLSFRLQRNPK